MTLYRRYDPQAKFWSLAEVREGVAAAHPEWLAEQVERSAVQLFEAICRLDSVWYNRQRRFAQHNELCRNPLCPQATTAAAEEAAWVEG
jgi:hypothetical protein